MRQGRPGLLVILLGMGCHACGPAGSVAVDAGADEGAILDAGAAADHLAGDGPAPRTYRGPLFVWRAEAGELTAFEREQIEVSPTGELILPAGGGHAEHDPYPAGSFQGGNYYSGGSYRRGSARSTERVSTRPFNSVVPSFEALTPPGTWIAIRLSARVQGSWSRDYVLGVWASSKETVRRHSVDGQDDETASVLTDTLKIKGSADALRLTVELFSAGAATPRVRGLAAIVADSTAQPEADQPTPAALGRVLEVPPRSQMIYPGGGGWCSPTSLSMLLAYWAAQLGRPELVEPVPTVADLVFDWIYDGAGNWTFNTAHAASAASGALHAVVTRLGSMHQLERLIAAGVPAAISISFAAGKLPGAPVSSTTGHLIVVRGFTGAGDVVCNDPAFPADAKVQVTYPRAELEQAWSHSQRTAYVVWPVGTALPVDPLGAF